MRLLVAAYKHRLRETIKVVTSWVAEEILSVSEHIRLASASPVLTPLSFAENLAEDWSIPSPMGK